MKEGAIGYELYLKYTEPTKGRNAVQMAREKNNGLLDSMVWKWAKPIIEEHFENQGKLRVNAYGETRYV